MRITVLACALALVATGACKDKDSKKQKTPGATKPTSQEVLCPAGQLMVQGKCETVVTPDKVAAVKQQAQQLGVIADTLAQFEKLEAPLAIIKLLMKSDAWKTAAKASKDLKSAEDVVKALDATVADIKAFSASATSGRAMLDLLAGRLAAVQGGTSTVKSLADLRKLITDELVKALRPLAEQAKKLATAALVPAVEQIKKVVEYAEAVCAVVTLGGITDLKKHCKDVKGASQAALAWLDKAKKTPDTFVADMVKELNTALGTLLDNKALDQLIK